MRLFRQKSSKAPSRAVEEHATAHDAAFALARDLEATTRPVTDDEIKETYLALASRMQTNCDSVAQGRLVVIASLCAHRNHLAAELLPSAMEPLYYLGVEDLEGVANYLKWLADHDRPYLGDPTSTGRDYLRVLASSPDVLRDAFRRMYELQDSPDKASVPEILQSEQGSTPDGDKPSN